MELSGKVAVVTGGASGLGEATVRRYVKAGVKVSVFDMDESRGVALAKELGSDVIFQKVNVADAGEVEYAVAETVKAFGAIHICNCFAGIVAPGKIYSKGKPMALSFFQKVIDVNLVGTFNVFRMVVAQMAEQEPLDSDGQRGVLVGTSSIAAKEGQIGQAAYSASKGGVAGMVLPLARELAELGIRVNALMPGLMHTPMIDSLPQDVFDSLSASPEFPQRMGNPDEIAHLCQFIAENNYVNGECIRLDAGLRMRAT